MLKIKPKFDYRQSALSSFLNDLGSSSVSPGGGSAAALAAAIGTALIEMVAGINEKKKQEAGGPPKRRRVFDRRQEIKKAQRLRKELTTLITKDTLVFKEISKYFKEGKTSSRYQKALKIGASVPLKICQLAGEAAKLGVLEKNRTSRWLYSDLKEALILLQAAFLSARLNVEINLKDISDKPFKAKTIRMLNRLEKVINGYKKIVGA